MKQYGHLISYSHFGLRSKPQIYWIIWLNFLIGAISENLTKILCVIFEKNKKFYKNFTA